MKNFVLRLKKEDRVKIGDMNRSITFVWTWASILSGGFKDCLDGFDSSCRGGLATIDAYSRYYRDEVTDVASLIIPRLDFQTPFVQMHPLRWNVNKLIMKHRFGWDTYFAEPSHFYVGAGTTHNLRAFGYRPLLSNSHSVYSNEWNGFIQDVHFDDKTGLAVMLVYDPSQANVVELTVDPDPAPRIQGLLFNINMRNMEEGCIAQDPIFQHFLEQTVRQMETAIDGTGHEDIFATSATNDTDKANNKRKCWIPVVVYDFPSKPDFHKFLNDMKSFNFPPALLIDITGNDPTYAHPKQVIDGMWVHSYSVDLNSVFHQHRIHLHQNGLAITNVTTIQHSTSTIAPEVKDEQFMQDIAYLRSMADEAARNNPVVGMSRKMPALVVNGGNTWFCLGGECAMGNLFADALRWHGDVDVGVQNSGGIRGPGWDEGEVRVSDLWEALPYANTYCEVHMTGLSLFKLFNFSTSVALFVSEFRGTADRLLQVSGMRLTYNTELETNRLISIDVMDKQTGNYKPLERLEIYKLATNSFLCEAAVPFSTMFNEDLTVKGEKRPQISKVLLQEIVARYLGQLKEPYNTTARGSLTNNTSAKTPMNWIQSPEMCNFGTYWVQDYQSCLSCPSTQNLTFAENVIRFSGQSGLETKFQAELELLNDHNFTLALEFKSSPSWVMVNPENLILDVVPLSVSVISFEASSESLEPGTAAGSVYFSVVFNEEEYPGCVGEDVSFEVEMIADPAPEVKKPSLMWLYIGFSLCGIAFLVCIGLATWVFRNRSNRTVLALQPEFLDLLCAGVIIFCASIIPISLTDELKSQQGRNICCMATVWLISLGFMTIMTSLAVMTWRINVIMRGAAHMRRTNVTVKKASMAFATLVIPNLLLLILWTVLDPLVWKIDHAPGNEWDQFGTCATTGSSGEVFQGLVLALDCLALLLALYHALKSWNVSEQYSHSKPLALAVFLGMQLSLVGLPGYFLINDDNPNAQYIVQVSLIFTIGMSIILVIIAPIIYRRNGADDRGGRSGGVHVSGTSGTNYSQKNSTQVHTSVLRPQSTLPPDESGGRRS